MPSVSSQGQYTLAIPLSTSRHVPFGLDEGSIKTDCPVIIRTDFEAGSPYVWKFIYLID